VDKHSGGTAFVPRAKLRMNHTVLENSKEFSNTVYKKMIRKAIGLLDVVKTIDYNKK